MILIDQNSNSTVSVKVGERITLRLKETPTTGYRWIVESSSGLKEIEDHFKAGGPALGAGGEHIFQFQTSQSGSYELNLKKWREWEGESSIIDRLIVKIIVK